MTNKAMKYFLLHGFSTIVLNVELQLSETFS